MSSKSGESILSGGWLDPSLFPAYGIAAVAIFALVRYVDKTYIRPPSKTGFGKGAPGFMTNTRQLKVTPEIAARLRRGEQVSPDEIQTAVRAVEERNAKVASREGNAGPGSQARTVTATDTPQDPPRRETRSKSKRSTATAPASEPVNEWIPDIHLKTRSSGRRRQK